MVYEFPSEAKTFWWQLCRNKLKVHELLFRFGLTSTPVCFLCCYDIETCAHLFLVCPIVTPSRDVKIVLEIRST